jgi:hypothetical protein
VLVGQDSARENLASKTNHSDEQSVLQAFKKNICRRRANMEQRKKIDFPVL